MESVDLDRLDAAIADIEAIDHAAMASSGTATRFRRISYRPTRDPGEIMRLMDKYISRVVRLKDAWVAVGPNGRGCVGATLAIAVCKAVVEAR